MKKVQSSLKVQVQAKVDKSEADLEVLQTTAQESKKVIIFS